MCHYNGLVVGLTGLWYSTHNRQFHGVCSDIDHHLAALEPMKRHPQGLTSDAESVGLKK